MFKSNITQPLLVREYHRRMQTFPTTIAPNASAQRLNFLRKKKISWCTSCVYNLFATVGGAKVPLLGAVALNVTMKELDKDTGPEVLIRFKINK